MAARYTVRWHCWGEIATRTHLPLPKLGLCTTNARRRWSTGYIESAWTRLNANKRSLIEDVAAAGLARTKRPRRAAIFARHGLRLQEPPAQHPAALEERAGRLVLWIANRLQRIRVPTA